MFDNHRYKAKTIRKLVIIILAIGIVAILCGIFCCQREEISMFLAAIQLRANYTPDYVHKNKDKVLVEIPEMFELANVAIAISDEGLHHPNRVCKHGAYYKRVLKHFEPFKNHPLIAESDLNYNFTYNFRDNSICYVFDGDRIVHTGLYSNVRWPNLFKRHRALAEDFARVSDFRKFYADNLPYYEQQIRFYRELVPVRKMWIWLEERFDAGHDCYKVVFSPLIGASHETCKFSSKDFSETIMFISGPGEPKDAPSKAEEGAHSRVVFTEIDHNYVNSVTDRYAGRVNKALADLDKWNKQGGYRGPVGTFNEYMTWAVFTLYVYDNYEREDFEAINDKMIRQMVDSRRFVLFEQFDTKLLGLYLAREPGQTIPDLYPAVLEWAEKFKQTE